MGIYGHITRIHGYIMGYLATSWGTWSRHRDIHGYVVGLWLMHVLPRASWAPQANHGWDSHTEEVHSILRKDRESGTTGIIC